MNKRVSALIEKARKLTISERAELDLRLQHEFADADSDGTPEGIQAAWVKECERRMASYDQGETTMSSSQEVHAAISDRLSRL
jgi:hypothetical protein